MLFLCHNVYTCHSHWSESQCLFLQIDWSLVWSILASGPTLLSSSNITKAKSVSTILKSDCLIIGVLHQQPIQGNRNDIFTILAPAQQILCTEKNGDKKLCVDLIWLDWLPVHNYSDFAYDSSYLGKLDPGWLTLILLKKGKNIWTSLSAPSEKPNSLEELLPHHQGQRSRMRLTTLVS